MDRWVRVLTVIEQFTRECLALFADRTPGPRSTLK